MSDAVADAAADGTIDKLLGSGYGSWKTVALRQTGRYGRRERAARAMEIAGGYLGR